MSDAPPSGPPPDQLPAFPPPAYPPPAYPPQPTLLSSGPTPERSRTPPVVLAVGLALLLVVGAVSVPLLLGHATTARDVPADLSAVKVYDNLQVIHTPADVTYPQSPPVGGPHDPVWLDCGVYDAPVRKENAVHDLEHGTVWISYDPDLDADDVAALAEALPQNGIMAPYPGLRSPVVVTVWGRQLALDGADDPRLALFISTFGGGETAPEPFMSCAGGTKDPDGGTGTAV